MITGYNHNIKHCGRIYHIQTEDSGTKYPHIITHLFVGGNIFASKKRSYAHLLEEDLDEAAFEKAVRGMMQEQHKDMLRELKAGKHDDIVPAYSSDDDLAGVSKVRVAGFHVAPESSDDLSEGESVSSEGEPAPPPRAPLFRVDVLSESSSSPKPEEPKGPGHSSGKRGEGRLSRRRMSRARPAFQTPPPKPSEHAVPLTPQPLSTAMEVIELLSLDSSDVLSQVPQDDEVPTIPDLPEATSKVESPLSNNVVGTSLPNSKRDVRGGGFSPKGPGRARGIRGRGARPPRPSFEPHPPRGQGNHPPRTQREPSPQTQDGESDDSESHHPKASDDSSVRLVAQLEKKESVG